MARKQRPAAPTCAPLVPDFIGRTNLEEVQRERIEELAALNQQLKADVKHLRVLLARERQRHEQLETALGKYQTLLERQIAEQREAFRTLGAALVPNALESK